MIIRLIIILLFSYKSYGQDYVYNWVSVKREVGVVNYQVQKSTDNVNWITIATIAPKKLNDSNKYSYTLPVANYSVRVKALFTSTVVYTPVKKIVNTNVVITNAKLRINTGSDNVSFTATGEAQVSFYHIERQNSSSSNWVIVGKLNQTMKKNYAVNITKIGTNRKYRMRAVYVNSIVSPYISFILD